MNSESDNSKKLNDFFNKEYRSLKIYVNTRIRDSVNRNAEDIIQDVALKLFTGADRYAPINNVAGFVYRSIKNRIIDIMRTKQVNPIEIDDEFLDLAEVLQQSTTDGYISEKTVSILKNSIKQLNPKYRDIIIAVDFEGYTYKEISKETGIPEGTLMSRRHRAIGLLYKQIESEINKHKK
ncbi:RNA polymerase sigma factor [Aquimarina sp. 2201CG5-10]|uniref:RNA polymerase sigma factor n=1 Tax=Aquimarina callyspongiae TaxID=3098150 RepID=UPI002AB40899|nr:RNA polymerase sigma factor [Aquimarina sp. 2201CG5-10]MDY8135476.1 RNA polymerase sigma factor [Aquimarina sp. 2201CG5-10]